MNRKFSYEKLHQCNFYFKAITLRIVFIHKVAPAFKAKGFSILFIYCMSTIGTLSLFFGKKNKSSEDTETYEIYFVNVSII